MLGLVVYGVFFFALIKLIPITLTLPGIAGLILTIGVAADANIVIFERIKEEARAGRSMLSAIAQGYRKGIATIIDANVITLFTAFILFVLATAGVKGFAFTLGIGTIVSLFTAVLFTQAVLGSLGRSRILHSPRALGRRRAAASRWHFDFTGASKWFFSISGAILAIGAISLATKQLNLGIDFTSGAKVTASLQKAATVDEVRNALDERRTSSNASSAEIQAVTERQARARTSFEIQGKIPVGQVNGTVKNALDDRASACAAASKGFQSTTVGPTFGAQVARSAVIAIIFSLLVISAYVAIRFEAKYAVPVIIALLHDILITARRLLADGPGGDERHRRRLPDHPRLLDVRHDDRLRPHPRERAADAARGLLPDRQPLDERGAHPVADHRALDRVPGHRALHLRRRDAARTSPSR